MRFLFERRKLLWPFVVAGLVVWASNHSQVASPDIHGSDKVAHFCVYGLLATLVCRIGGTMRAAIWALIVTSAFGATDEWHQSFVPGRTCDVFDWLADTSGAALAVALYVGWSAYRRLLERPLQVKTAAAPVADRA
ncbi:MAG TPA: VanZ family protein [Opitutaceae bacterium]|nr:VanZ family protein [Opitutaceae bacterium]